VFKNFVFDSEVRLAVMLGVAALVALVMPTSGILRSLAASLAVSVWGGLIVAAAEPISWSARELHVAQVALCVSAVAAGVYAGRRSEI
jgi:uncharacterized membrane protein YGL010W